MALPTRSLSSISGLIERRPFGRHPDSISVLGVGGYHLGKTKTAAGAIRIAHEAIDAGVNFFDNAAEYHDRESERAFDGDSQRQLARSAVVEALDQAKTQGKVRYVGFTSHEPTEIHVRMLTSTIPSIVSGIDSLRALRRNVRIAQRFEPMPTSGRQSYEQSLVALMDRRSVELFYR